MPATTDVNVWVGADLVEVIQFKDSANVAVPMAGATVHWRIVDWRKVQVLSVTLTTGVGMPAAAQTKANADFGSLDGVACLQLTPAQTRLLVAGNYYAHEIEYRAGGSEQVLAYGRIFAAGGVNPDA